MRSRVVVVVSAIACLVGWLIPLPSAAAASDRSSVVPRAAGTVPATPLITSASGDGLAVLVAWLPNDPADQVTGYTLTATPRAGSVTTDCPAPVAKTMTTPASSSGTWIPGLCAQVPYQVTMTATNATGTSAVSVTSPWAVPLPATTPQAPQLVQVLGRSAALQMAWSPSAFNGGKPVTGYVVKVKKGATVVKSVTALSTATTAIVSGLVNGTAYTVTLQAKNAAGLSGASTMTGTPSTVYRPSAPTQVTARPDGTGKIVVSWAAPIDDGGSTVTGYAVTWRQVDQAGVPVPGTPLHTATTTGTALTAIAGAFEATQALYQFTVTASNAAGTGAGANPVAPIAPLVQLTPNTVVLSDATAAAATAVTATAVTWPAPAPTQITGLVPGKVIVAGATRGTPNGLLRVVASITTSGSTVVVATTEGDLNDVFVNASLAISANLISTNPGARATNAGRVVEIRPMSPGVSVERAVGGSVGGSITVDINEETKDGVFISAKLTLATEIKTSFDVRTGWGGLPKGIAIDAESTVSSTLQAQVGWKGDWQKKIAEITGPPVTYMAGFVPVVVQPVAPIYLTGSGKVAVGVSVVTKLGGGLSWDSSSPRQLRTRNLSSPPKPTAGMIPGLTATADGSVGVKVDTLAKLYGSGGPGVSVDNSLGASINFNPPPGEKFLTIDDTLSVDATLKFDRFGISGDVSAQVYAKTWADLFSINAVPTATYTITSPIPAATPGQAVTLTAVRSDGATATKTWTVIGGVLGDKITATGVFTPAQPAGRTVTVGVTDVSGVQGLLNLVVGKVYDSPKNLTLAPVISGNDYGIVATWTPPTNTGGGSVTKYVATTQPAISTKTVPAPTTTATWTGLTKGTTYVVTVVAVNSVGGVSPTATARITLDDASPPGVAYKQISTGELFTCAVTTTGAAKCWGYNYYGQLGDGTTTDRLTPVTVTGLASGVATISAGDNHTCAVTTTGAAKCWGINTFGKLGDGTTTNRLTPVTVSGLTSGVASITAGNLHTCAVTTTGAAKCWGNNGSGELGDGTTTNRITPTAVSGLTSGVARITAGDSDTCAVTTAGAAKCWGNNGTGQLGDGTTTNRLTPTAVSGLTSGVASITASYWHTCAVTITGAAKCWGDNTYGELGDGTTTDRLTPTAVSGLVSGTIAITGNSFYFTCAVTTAGAAKCWGFNGSGHLGDGTTTNRLTPVTVSGLATETATVASGYKHACAVTKLGVAKCWGYNLVGQLGDGTTTDRLTPVDVLP